MGCGEALVKYILFFLNLIFALGGLALLGIGIAVQVQASVVTNLLPDGHFEVAPILTMVVGSIAFVISFFGCCGAIRESNCMLMTYGVMMFILMGLKVAFAVVVFVKTPDINTQVPKLLNDLFNISNMQPFYEIQKEFECCGTYGYQVYADNSLPLPASCCPESNSTVSVACDAQNVFRMSCNEAVTDFFRAFAITIASVTLVVAAIELVAMVFGCCLASHVRNKQRRARY